MDLGRVGVWWSGSWHVREDPAVDVAAEIESLGYGTLWSSGGFQPGLAPHFERLLAGTRQLHVASGIVSVWASEPADIGRSFSDLDDTYPGRFVLGLGASHSAIVPDYRRPYSRVVAYLDALDALDEPVSRERRVLAALGPRMLELAAARAAGAHPYFVPVEHTARARALLGEGPLLAPEVAVVLDSERESARRLARTYASIYLPLRNYTQNLRTLGFEDDDLDGKGAIGSSTR
jgi:probable F420-dependent oxidoreductase